MVDLMSAKKVVLVLLYVAAVVVTYFLFASQNVILFKVVIASLLFLILIFFTFNIGVLRQGSVAPSESSEMLRYTMLCRSCGWEWMSNVTRMALAPTKCPTCGDNKLEVLGWRRVKVLNKKNKDLREFVK